MIYRISIGPMPPAGAIDQYATALVNAHVVVCFLLLAANDGTIVQHGDHKLPAAKRILACQRDELLHERANFLGLGQGGFNLPKLKKALGEVAPHRQMVGGSAG